MNKKQLKAYVIITGGYLFLAIITLIMSVYIALFKKDYFVSLSFLLCSIALIRYSFLRMNALPINKKGEIE